MAEKNESSMMTSLREIQEQEERDIAAKARGDVHDAQEEHRASVDATVSANLAERQQLDEERDNEQRERTRLEGIRAAEIARHSFDEAARDEQMARLLEMSETIDKLPTPAEERALRGEPTWGDTMNYWWRRATGASKKTPPAKPSTSKESKE
jgi:hypothetical protein